jgi:hypothetical protein
LWAPKSFNPDYKITHYPFLLSLLCRFLLDDHLHVRGHVLVQLHRHVKLAHGFQRFVQLNLATIDMEALFLKRLGDIT